MKKKRTALILYNLFSGKGINITMRSYLYSRPSDYPQFQPVSMIFYFLSCNKVGKNIEFTVSGLEDRPEVESKVIEKLVEEIRGYKVSRVTVSINGNVLNL